MKLILFASLIFIANICLSYGATVVNEGFENMTDISGTWTTVFPSCKGTGTATIDTSVAHSGKHSVRIDGQTNYCNHVFISPTADLSTLGKVWYVRFYIRHSTALGDGHIAFITMKDTNDGGKDLRIGGQNKALQWNRESDDATLPSQSPVGIAASVPLDTAKWVCFEFMVNGNDGTASIWLDGKEIAGLHAGSKVQDVDQAFLSKTWRPALADLKLGWETYGNGADTLWYDDVAVGSAKIGCL